MQLSRVVILAAALVAAAPAAEAVVVCRGRIAGEGTGTGLFGQATTVARQNAIADWTSKASTRHGAGFANLARSRGVTYDCRQGAIFQGKCVVTAAPCGDVRVRKATKKKRRVRR